VAPIFGWPYIGTYILLLIGSLFLLVVCIIAARYLKRNQYLPANDGQFMWIVLVYVFIIGFPFDIFLNSHVGDELSAKFYTIKKDNVLFTNQLTDLETKASIETLGSYLSTQKGTREFIVTDVERAEKTEAINIGDNLNVEIMEKGIYWGDTIRSKGIKPGYNPIGVGEGKIHFSITVPNEKVESPMLIKGLIKSIPVTYPKSGGNLRFQNVADVVDSQIIQLRNL
jgi:hypothetical protein